MREDGSQSPDVIQQGTTTNETKRPSPGRIGPRKGLSTQSSSSLASQIVGNPNSTQITMKPRVQRQERHSDLIRFDFSDVKCSFLNVPTDLLENVSFFVDVRRKEYVFDFKDAMLEPPSQDMRYDSLSMPYSIKQINRIWHGDASGKMILRLSNVEGRPNGPIALDLVSPKKVNELIHTLQDLVPSIPVSHTEDRKIERIFENSGAAVAETVRLKAQNAQYDYYSTQRSPTTPVDQSTTREKSKQQTRVVDRLDHVSRQSPTIITGKDREMAMPSGSEEEAAETRQRAPNPDLQDGERSGLTSQYFTERSTRAQGSRSSNASGNRKARSPSPPKVKFSQTGGLGDPWKQPLTYPKNGKKRENVGFGDLWRLDDDEFLNDTLIGFFLRYLQHRTEVDRPEVLKKIHFFNSYFFDTLNKGTKTAKTSTMKQSQGGHEISTSSVVTSSSFPSTKICTGSLQSSATCHILSVRKTKTSASMTLRKSHRQQ